ncbi:MAG: DUF523 domain-containing protein [Eubacteriales bacterium]
MNILVSACLLGFRCRYDGDSRVCAALERISEHNRLIPFCPEIYGGLPTPRPSAEISGDRVITRIGGDVTAQYAIGAEQAVYAAKAFSCELCILKERSPSCGRDYIYDGTFSGKLIPGSGIAARMLMQERFNVIGESEISKYFSPEGEYTAPESI